VPLKLVPPRPGKTPRWYIRGTYLKRYVDQSSGSTERAVARQVLNRIKGEIERGEFAGPAEATFLSAAVAYMEAGGERRFVAPLLDHFKERSLVSIDQAAIDEAAAKLYPSATAATRNRQVYTVVSAILKHGGIDHKLKRPKGSAGTQRTDWLWPEQAFAIFKAADKIDGEFGVFLRLLCYTGMRLSEALNLRWEDVRLDEGFAYLPQTKNSDPRAVFLTPALRTALAAWPRRVRLARWSKSGHLYDLLRQTRIAAGFQKEKETAEEAAEPRFPTFHTLRHTWATWMRRYAGLDTAGLVATRAWRDRKSAARYEHVVVSEEAMKAILLPTENSGESVDFGVSRETTAGKLV
jgi:integrase